MDKKRGFASTGMDALAAAAGVTTGAVYSQFRSKSDLLYAIVDQELSHTVEAFIGKTGEDLKKVLALYMSGCPVIFRNSNCIAAAMRKLLL